MPTPFTVKGCPESYSTLPIANVSELFYLDYVKTPHAWRSFILPQGWAFYDLFFIIIVITITPDQQVVFSLDPTTVAKLVPVSGT